MRLYPTQWRKRYGDELDALLSDTGADARVVADLFKGGVRMQFSTWSFAKLATVLVIVGVLLGAVGSFLITPVYVSKATLLLTPAANMDSNSVLSGVSLYQLIVDPNLQLYKTELITTPLEDVIERMRENITITPVASAFTVSFGYANPLTAQRTVAALAKALRDRSDQIQRTFPKYAGKRYLEVVDAPRLPIHPLFFSQPMLMVIGTFLGLLIASAWRMARRKPFASRRFAFALVTLGLIGAIAGYAVCQDDRSEIPLRLLGEQYRSTALLSVHNATPEQIQMLMRDVLTDPQLAFVITDPRLRLYFQQMKAMPLGDVVNTMRKHLTFSRVGEHGIEIAFDYEDRYKAEMTVRTIMARFDEATYRLFGGLPDAPVTSPSPAKLTILHEPTLPVLPVSPDRYRMAGTGGLAGLLAASIIALIRRRWVPESEIPMDAVNG